MFFVVWLLLWLKLAAGNVEKTIFTSPAFDTTEVSALQDLELGALSPAKPSIRIELDTQFPSDTAPRGAATWLYLHSLHPGQRYEVRVCWLATQPTDFTLSTYTLPVILDSPDLRSSLMPASSIKATQQQNDPPQLQVSDASQTRTSLFLLIESAADYFTLNETLMTTVPPVYADVILDPYIFNVLPESLVGTAGYLVVVAGAAWYLSRYVWSVVRRIGQVDQAAQSQRTALAGKKDI